MVACLFFVFTLAISLATRFIFVNKARDFLWIPLFVCTMFSPADGGFVTSVYPFFWMWAIYSAATFVLIRYLARRDPGIIR